MKIAQGYRTGKLEVIADSGLRKSGYIIWRCVCDCGGSIDLDTRALQRGLIHDCGCETKITPRQKEKTELNIGNVSVPAEKKQWYGVRI